MCYPLRALLFLLLCSTLTNSAFAQLFNLNPPKITGQRPTPLITEQNTPITIAFENLRVTDPDILVPPYPQGFTLMVFPGNNYTVENTTVTPAHNFVGNLIVQVQVNDGKFDSNIFDLEIIVTNLQPVITAQEPDPIEIKKGQSYTLSLENLKVTDDNAYPSDFTLTIFEGKNYTTNGNTIIPDANFTGKLKVLVTVYDGHEDSDKFEVMIEVKEKNAIPKIKDQVTLSTNEDQSITIVLKNLTVEDPDNRYPDDFTLKIPQGPGNNYTVLGNKITPSANFFGTLTVPVRVNDGLDDSEPFNLKITVTSENDAPVIAGQNPNPIIIREGTSYDLKVTSLTINDPDPNEIFTIKILPGSNYTFSGNRITPTTGFTGMLTVKVVVNDGNADSAPFNLQIDVAPKGSAPLITGQQPLVMNEDESKTLDLNDLYVMDEDSNYDEDFTMKIHGRQYYTLEGLTVTPGANFNGMLTVFVSVNDGTDDSSPYPFPLKIYVIPVNDAPQITALEETSIAYEPGTGPITITDLFTGQDIDNPYLSFAEISFDSTFKPLNDELIFQNTEHIRGIYDPSKGILSLIGYATVGKYDSAIRSIKYNYILTQDEEGNQSEILPGPKYIHFTLSDGALISEQRSRVINIESSAVLDIPNTFTPNNDAANDTWRIRSLTNTTHFDKAIIKVYNKRGLLIYEAKGIEKGWDGSFNGEVLPVDTYYYTIDLRLSYTKKTYKGVVMILR